MVVSLEIALSVKNLTFTFVIKVFSGPMMLLTLHWRNKQVKTFFRLVYEKIK